MKKAIVIGANGYLGYKLTSYLVEKGVSVVALVPVGFDYSNVSSIPEVDILEFTFGKLHELDSAAAIKNVDIIYNMAWIGVNAKDRNNENIQASNILCNVEVVKYADRNRIKRLLVPGSAAQYACSGRVIDGTGAFAPSDLYSAAKSATYDICSLLCKQKGIDLIWPVITSIYGPGRDDNNLLSYVIKSLLSGKIPSTTKLEQVWDYLYIDDLINAIYLLGENGKGGKIYPVGSGEHNRMSEYVYIIRDLIDPNLTVGIGELPYKNSTIDNQVLDIRALICDTGFAPSVSFSDGIKNVIDWFKNM